MQAGVMGLEMVAEPALEAASEDLDQGLVLVQLAVVQGLVNKRVKAT